MSLPPPEGRRRSLRSWVAWHLAALAVAGLLPSYIQFGTPPWSVPEEHLPVVAALVGCHLLAAALSTALFVRGRYETTLFAAVAVPGLVFGALYLVLLLLPEVRYSRVLLLAASMISIVLIAAASLFLLQRTLPRWLVASAVASLGALAVVTGVLSGALRGTPGENAGTSDEDDRPVTRDTVLYTTHKSLEAHYYYDYLEEPEAPGGGVDAVGDEYLVVTGEGALYRLAWKDGSDSLSVVPMDLHVPLNDEEFAADIEGWQIDTWRFRVADVSVRMRRDHLDILVSHHHWDTHASCYVLRLSALELSLEEWRRGAASDGWRTAYETEPCLPLNEHPRGEAFAGHQAGGRIAPLEGERVLLTVGDHQLDGWNSEAVQPQDPETDYGKTVLVDLANGTAEVFSLGHRNAQGLYVDGGGRIWLTEHGPKGGDELNEVVAGGNYGWPFVTDGADYEDVVWPLNREGGRPTSFRSPVFAWVPSIGISNLLRVEDAAYPEWRGDLLVSSLKEQSLYRLRLRDEEVAFVERIPVDVRVRDLVNGERGRIVLWTDEGTIVALEPGDDLEEGEILFAQCVGCHTGSAERAQDLGPDLAGVYGRDIGSVPGFDYSPALRRLEGRWTEERLDAFLADPNAFAPGTSMRFGGVPDSVRRAALIEFLKTLE